MTDAFHTLIPLKSRRFADSEKIRSSANRHLVHPSKEVHIDRTQRFAYRSRFVHDFREFSMRSDFWSSFHALQGRMHAMIRSHIDRCFRPLRFLVHLIRHSEKTRAARNSNLFRKLATAIRFRNRLAARHRRLHFRWDFRMTHESNERFLPGAFKLEYST